MSYQFVKMHGLGNDFVIMDTRDSGFKLGPKQIQKVSDRRYGVGCDQLIALEKPNDRTAAVKMRIFNADGSEAQACGNATRCVAWLLNTTEAINNPTIETIPGLLQTEAVNDNSVTIKMVQASLDWQKIPLSAPLNAHGLSVTFKTLTAPIAVNMGNPHIVFIVEDASSIDLDKLGESLNNHKLFPEGVNVELVEIQDFNSIKVKVFERGAGITTACGSGACASAVATSTAGLTSNNVQVNLAGGPLQITVDENLNVTMQGPIEMTFEGSINEDILV